MGSEIQAVGPVTENERYTAPAQRRAVKMKPQLFELSCTQTDNQTKKHGSKHYPPTCGGEKILF